MFTSTCTTIYKEQHVHCTDTFSCSFITGVRSKPAPIQSSQFFYIIIYMYKYVRHTAMFYMTANLTFSLSLQFFMYMYITFLRTIRRTVTYLVRISIYVYTCIRTYVRTHALEM